MKDNTGKMAVTDDSQEQVLPEQFRRKFSDLYDSGFMRILVGSIIIHAVVVIYFLINPIAKDLFWQDIADMQEHLARTIREREKMLEEQYVQFEFEEQKDKPASRKLTAARDAAEDTPADKTAPGAEAGSEAARSEGAPEIAEKSGPDKSQTRGRRGGEKSGRARPTRSGSSSHARIAAEVSNRGVLALLTSSSAYAAGEEMADVISGSRQSGGDLDKKIARLTSLKSSSRSGAGGAGGSSVKGTREQGSAGIDEMVSGLGNAEDETFVRGGELVVSMDDTEFEGDAGSAGSGRDPSEVQSVILGHNKTIQYCYERELKRNPTLRGKLTVRFTITPSGRVKNVEIVASTLNNRSVERSIVNRIRRWNDFGSIAASFGNTTVRQTYAFGY